LHADNRVIIDSSGIQAAFILDPTISGIKACDTLEFLLEVKNVKRGSTYDHAFKYLIPNNYQVDTEGWGFIYPFNKREQIDLVSGSIHANIRRFHASYLGETGNDHAYEFDLGDMSTELSTCGIPGYDPTRDSFASIAIICRVFTSCDFSTPGFVQARVQASTVCKSESVNAATNSAKPILDGVDLSRLNDYALIVDPVDSITICGDTIQVNSSIINTSAGEVLHGEVLQISVPPGIILYPPVSDNERWDWDNAVFSSNQSGSSWSIALPGGAWTEKKISFTAILVETNPAAIYNVRYQISYEDEISCSSQQTPCQVKIPSGEWNGALHFRECETITCDIDVLDDSALLCGNYVQINVLDNDNLACGYQQAEVSRQPYNGAVIAEGNTLLYIPDPDFTSGTDTFYYQVCSDMYPNICDEAKVIVVAGNCHDLSPPVANDDSVMISSGRSAMISLLSNDYDPDGSEIWVCRGVESILSRPSYGSVNIIGDSIATYVPELSFSGTDQFSYEICDVDGLKDTATVTIVVLEGNNCDMPNGFSPNGDGINDVLVVPCVSSGPKQLHVWNRWGNELYFSTDYRDAWDGTYKGGLLPAGNYFYSLIYEDMTGNEIRLAGYLAIYQ
jgi:gliding motility-associated-like protein